MCLSVHWEEDKLAPREACVVHTSHPRSARSPAALRPPPRSAGALPGFSCLLILPPHQPSISFSLSNSPKHTLCTSRGKEES